MIRYIPEDFEQQLTNILRKMGDDDISSSTARKDIMTLLKATPESALNSGDELDEYGEYHREEAETIKRVLRDYGYVNAGLNDAIGLWGQYSDGYAAGWLGLPDNDEEIFKCIEHYI